MTSPYRINLIFAVTGLLGSAIILVTGYNKDLFIAINSSAAYINPFIWANVTFMGDTMAACSIMILFIRKRPDLVWSGILAAIIGTVVVNLLKAYFNIQRPPSVIDKDTINIIGPALYNHSFPSGHTVTIFALAGILLFYFRSFIARLGICLLAIFVGMSRIAVGVHWPADVLAGASIGCLSAMAGFYIVSKFGWDRIRRLQIVTGLILILSNFYLLFFYNSRYEQAFYLQVLLALVTLVEGIREYYLFFRNHQD